MRKQEQATRDVLQLSAVDTAVDDLDAIPDKLS
jgi:hypothetical protein